MRLLESLSSKWVWTHFITASNKCYRLGHVITLNTCYCYEHMFLWLYDTKFITTHIQVNFSWTQQKRVERAKRTKYIYESWRRHAVKFGFHDFWCSTHTLFLHFVICLDISSWCLPIVLSVLWRFLKYSHCTYTSISELSQVSWSCRLKFVYVISSWVYTF